MRTVTGDASSIAGSVFSIAGSVFSRACMYQEPETFVNVFKKSLAANM